MVLDTIDQASRYFPLGEGISKALHYILENNLSELKTGRYEINGDRLVLIVFDQENTNTNKFRLEGHRRYIDLQYWIAGSELMGHEILNSQPVLEEYNETTDCGFYHCAASFSRLLPGMFVIYYPTDLHSAVNDQLCNGRVRKVVFKIQVEA